MKKSNSLVCFFSVQFLNWTQSLIVLGRNWLKIKKINSSQNQTNFISMEEYPVDEVKS